MSEHTFFRQPGAPLPSDLVRQLRKRLDLSQEALALRLGLKGGKSVVSGWETGRTQCEGPAAELLLLIAGTVSPSLALLHLQEEAESIWRRAGNFVDSWRQVTAVPEVSTEIDRNDFVNLFPGVAIPPKQYVHGFPFVDLSPLPDVHGISSAGWTGIIPPQPNRSPTYLWLLKRHGEFIYRERRWEDDKGSITYGHVHVGSLLEVALATVVFLGRLAKHCNFDLSMRYVLQIELEGMQGLGIVGGDLNRADNPRNLSTANRIQAAIIRPISEIISAPLSVGYSLVGELTLSLRPDLADNSALERQVLVRQAADKEGGNRHVRFLDDLLRPGAPAR